MRLIIEPGGDSNHRVIVKPGGMVVLVLSLVLALLLILSATGGALRPLPERQKMHLRQPVASVKPGQPTKLAKPIKSRKPATKITKPRTTHMDERKNPERSFLQRLGTGYQQAIS